MLHITLQLLKFKFVVPILIPLELLKYFKSININLITIQLIIKTANNDNEDNKVKYHAKVLRIGTKLRLVERTGLII